MFGTISFNTFSAKFINLFVRLAVNSGRHLQKDLLLLARIEKHGEGDELGLDGVEGSVLFQDFLNDFYCTSHMKSVISLRITRSLWVSMVISLKRSMSPIAR